VLKVVISAQASDIAALKELILPQETTIARIQEGILHTPALVGTLVPRFEESYATQQIKTDKVNP